MLGALRGDEWVENRPTTHGIEIKPVEVSDPTTGTAITLNGWDFGGQPVCRPTYQLFFSTPAVYLVVWKPREGPQQGFVKEWIKLVKHREPDAKILVVATHGGPGARQPTLTGRKSGICSARIECLTSSMSKANHRRMMRKIVHG